MFDCLLNTPLLPVNNKEATSYMKTSKFYYPFLRRGFNCLKATEPLQRDSLLLTTRSQGIPGTHLINFDCMKVWNNLDLEATQQNWPLRNNLPSTSSALLISMSVLQKSNISVVNQNDMLIKQKTKVFIINFFNMFCKLKQIKVYEIVFYRPLYWKDLIQV